MALILAKMLARLCCKERMVKGPCLDPNMYQDMVRHRECNHRGLDSPFL